MRITINRQTPKLNQYQMQRTSLRHKLSAEYVFLKAARIMCIMHRGAKMRPAAPCQKLYKGKAKAMTFLLKKKCQSRILYQAKL